MSCRKRDTGEMTLASYKGTLNSVDLELVSGPSQESDSVMRSTLELLYSYIHHAADLCTTHPLLSIRFGVHCATLMMLVCRRGLARLQLWPFCIMPFMSQCAIFSSASSTSKSNLVTSSLNGQRYLLVTLVSDVSPCLTLL